MSPRNPLRLGLLLGLGLASGLSSCGSGGGGGGGDGSSSMFIVNCSLGCPNSSTNPGALVTCGESDVYLNEEIRIEFSAAVDPNTVNNNSFRMVDRDNGQTPPASFSIDPNNDRILVYRPSLTFDSSGNPIFGLTDGHRYELRVLGTRLDNIGPYIRSRGGAQNETRMQCFLDATRGVLDASEGRPSVTMTVDTVTGYDPDGNPNEFNLNVLARGAVDVFRGSPVRMVFNDVMNPATLANPVTGSSDFIQVFVDADGDTTDRSDQVPLRGGFTLTIDQTNLRTTVVFTPSAGFPSAGHGAAPRKVVVDLSAQIADLGGNLLLEPGTYSFTPEVIDFDPIVVLEEFNDSSAQDPLRTGTPWGAGMLGKGQGGGSGVLGDLTVLAGQTVELSTVSEDFSAITDPQTFNPVNVVGSQLPVAGGVFQFSRLRVDVGGTLRLTGTQPARLYVRGEASIQGTIDISGADALVHTALIPAGGAGGASGAGGGSGGDGGDRPDGTNFFGIGGVPNPGAGPSDVQDPATYVNVDGQSGVGIPAPSSIDPNATPVANGKGGLAWPRPIPAHPELHMPFDPSDLQGMQFDPLQRCSTPIPGGPGSGGGHSFNGGNAALAFTPSGGFPPILPPNAAGGNVGPLMIDDVVRTLSPELGLLRGGGGGGGGGAHLELTKVNDPGNRGSACDQAPTGQLLMIDEYVAHSSAGGGGGGGALQVVSGRRINQTGIIRASGGDGGSGTFPPPDSAPTDLAQAGGGGAGGAVLLQAPLVTLQAVPGRIDVTGGEGGTGTGSVFPLLPSRGGRGSPGFVRLESNTPPTVSSQEAKILPREADLQAQYGPTAMIENLFSTGLWEPPPVGPSGQCGAQSCWFRPQGNFFQLLFDEDASEPGWDLMLRIKGVAEPQSYRGPNDLFPNSIEEILGSTIGSSPLVVRFQGARAVGTLIDPCAVPEFGVASPLAAGSPTGWVTHPAELNTFHADSSLSPNVFRFIVIWDRSRPGYDMIEGIESLRVTLQPD